MSATNAFETDLLKLIFTNVSAPNVGDATGLVKSTTDGVFWISLHTSDPGETGDQTTNEAGYTSYARVSVVRTTSGWSVSGNTATNVNAITFPACTGGSSTVTYFGIGSASSGAGHLFFSGALAASLAVSNGITPSVAASGLSATAD